MSVTPEWFIAPSLDVLLKEVNAVWPDRIKASDGGLGNPSHAARKSDHNPDYDAPGRDRGVVRARDYTVVDIPTGKIQIDANKVLQCVLGDDRVEYVIWNKKIYSRSAGWKARSYLLVNPAGYFSNPHTHHIHVSIRHTDEAAFDTRPWGLEDEVTPQDKKDIIDGVVAALKPEFDGVDVAAFAAVKQYFEQPFAHIGDEAAPTDRSNLTRHLLVAVRVVREIQAKLTGAAPTSAE